MIQSAWARRYFKWLAILLLGGCGVALLSFLTLRLGDCHGGFGWAVMHCTRIPDALGRLAFSIMMGGTLILWDLRWALIPIFAIPLIAEWRARRS
ncbi:MAG: hypothetical protein AAFV27_04005 [Pseudomonadota bacterium]